MQTSNKIFDDLARVADGAVSTLVGIKDEVEAMIRHRVEGLLADANLVTRDEFDAVKAMAAEARAEQERLTKRLSALETANRPPRKAAKRRPRKSAKQSR
jgi:hypothetical protein